ncbi:MULTISPECIES: LuxR C-terminal-related transcriptional regulator [Dethiosulfovibrio]|uniref:LuxR C-terminal-related transcriptional regulator n=2 Tax=Dethiosulfovibrio TaxID=47054 RepID=A0ABS9EWT0_9BACT|nr:MULTISPECIES: LuxR C-terminal-related transcriptional regulator [Dethiosulfovibrio]MCF4113304.1 LuxR C-terminal-related transcriptional regulator [Dethiosulfovibrio russensis]MCF4145620.1 LuxR C-terminal-related transcriptional regulator [Dethiosulfovibrio acidaminovorans]
MTRDRLFSPPKYGTQTIYRKRMGAFLDKNIIQNKRWVYIEAPSGFGKTVSISRWISPLRNKLAWINLSIDDDVPERFVHKLVKAMAFAQKSNRKLAKAAESTGPPREVLYRSVSSLLDNDKNYVVVVDDFQHISDNETLEILSELAINPSFRFTLCILSRKGPPKELSPSILNGNMALMTEEYLVMDEEEISSMMTKHHMSRRKSEEVISETKGWPVAVNSYLMGDEGDWSLLDDYLDSRVWDRWPEEVREFMVRAAPCPRLDEDICRSLNGSRNYEPLLKHIRSSDAFLENSEDGGYSIFPPFREYLLRRINSQLSKDRIDEIHRYLGRIFFDEGDYLVAADLYVRCLCLSGLSDCCTAMTKYRKEISVHSRFRFFKERVLGRIKFTEDEGLPLLAQSAFMYYLDGNAERFTEIMDMLYKRAERCGDGPFASFLTLLKVLDFRIPLNLYLERVIDGKETPTSSICFGKSPSPGTFTANMPLMHRSLRERSDLALSMEELHKTMARYREPLKKFLGQDHIILRECQFAGVLYEQNHLEEAYHHAVEAQTVVMKVNCRRDVRFCSDMILIHILKAMGRRDEASMIACEMERQINRDRATDLIPNLKAWRFRERMVSGDGTAAEEWLISYGENPILQPDLYDIYRHFTTERALIASGKPALAVLFGEKLLRLSQDFNRPMDELESYILLSTAYWSTDDRTRSYEYIEKALALAEPYGYVRMFLDEALSIKPMMVSFLRRTKSDGRRISGFASEVALAVTGTSYEDVVPSLEETSLSERQMRILALLKGNGSYRDIAEDLGIAHSTAKYHVTRLYRFLGVSNGAEALRKARSMGII